RWNGKPGCLTEWFTLTYEYTARGNERYVLIGNFKPDEDTEYKPVKSEKISMKIAYYVKNVSLTSVHSLPVCDYSLLLQRLRNDRHRHSLFSLQFFQDSLAIQATKPKKIKHVPAPVIPDSIITPPPSLPTIYFDFDQYALQEHAVAELSTLISYLQSHTEVNIVISGHTDDKGTLEYNNILATKRAETVKEYIISKGVQPNRITTNGYGETNPATDNRTDKGRQLNRRVEIRLLNIQLID
ncbi:MAG TPA: OmpA family protein, partial [Bacteroidales bacterium]|nr:OmpA family protein [Bacteroidales bacterium]